MRAFAKNSANKRGFAVFHFLTIVENYSIIKADYDGGGVSLLTIGLCGGSGTGKTEAQADFALCGIPGLDTDAVYHALIASDTPLTRELAECFGEGILTAGGGVDRAILATLVFGEDEESVHRRKHLNSITHRAVLAECREWLAKQHAAGAYAAIINAPLLFESGFHTECDLTVAILAPREARIDRIMARDGISRVNAARRIDAQLDDEYLIAHTDYQIDNNSQRADLYTKVAHLASIIKNISGESKNGKQ